MLAKGDSRACHGEVKAKSAVYEPGGLSIPALACSRRSDSGERREEWGAVRTTAKKKNAGKTDGHSTGNIASPPWMGC